MKICIINTLGDEGAGGGAERSVNILARGLVELGHKVTLIALNSNERVVEWFGGVRKVQLGLVNLYWPFSECQPHSWILRLRWHWRDRWNQAMAALVAKEWEEDAPDVLMTNNLAGFSVAVWAEAKRRNLPIVHVIRDYYLLCVRSSMYRSKACGSRCFACRLFRLRSLRAISFVDVFVGISQYIARVHRCQREFASARIEVIGNPFAVSQASHIDYRVRSRPVIFGYLGRLVPEKGVVEAINAFVQANVPGEFLIAGDGCTAETRACQTAASRGRVRLLGRVDAAILFEQIDVLIVPSRWGEAFGRVVIEAAMVGIPSIVAKTGGLPELVKNGETGWAFETFEELTCIITQVAVEPRREEMYKACRAYALRFSAPAICANIEALLTEVVARKVPTQ